MPHDQSDPVVEVKFGGTGPARPPSPGPATAPARTPPSMKDIVELLVEKRSTVIATTAAVLALAGAYLFVATPVYQAATVLQLEDKNRTLTGLEDLSHIIGEAATPAETEIEIIRSRSLVAPVVGALGLDVVAVPLRLPYLGNAIARRHRGAAVAGVPFGLAGLGLAKYGWGGERIRLQELEVSDDLLDQRMILTALDGDRYRLAAPDGTTLVEGTVGVDETTGTSGERRIEILVSELVARPGTEFVVLKRDRAEVANGILALLRVQETAKKTGILVATLAGTDPAQVASTLNSLAEAYVRRNVERKSAEAQQTLAFLESQLPKLKANVDQAEAALNAYQQKKHTVNVSRETEGLLTRTVDVEKALSELQMQQSDLRQRFTDRHPALVSITEKIARLQAQRATMDQQLRGVPERELDAARLTRDVKVATELYLLLLNKAQEIKVARSGVVGNVTVVDPALVPRRPASPKTGMVMSLALLLGLGLGVAVVLARKAFEEGAEDPREIEVRAGLPVFVTIPHSEAEERLDRATRHNPRGSRRSLAETAPGDLAVEALRSLRTALQFALVEAPNNIVALGAPAPGVGKSFVSVNLAHLLAAAGRRVLLVDCDLRRGRLHRYFSVERQPGLSDVVSGAATLDEAIRKSAVERLDVLPTGRIPPNPSELLSSQRFQQLMAALSMRYDLVVVDTPPVLAVTDPTLVARLAGVNLLVLRAGRHPIHEIVHAAKQLSQAGVKVQGAILNDGLLVAGAHGPKSGYYRYEYRSDPS